MHCAVLYIIDSAVNTVLLVTCKLVYVSYSLDILFCFITSILFNTFYGIMMLYCITDAYGIIYTYGISCTY